MFVWIGLGVLYVILLVTLGLATVRKGHWMMFILGVLPAAVLGDWRIDRPDRSRHQAGARRLQVRPSGTPEPTIPGGERQK